MLFKQSKRSSIAAVEQQLAQVNTISTEDRKALFAFAKEYATLPGSKVTRAKDGQPSRVLADDGTDVTQLDREIPSFAHSALNYNGRHYIFLEGDVFYELGNEANAPEYNPFDSGRGLRRGKLAIDENGDVFFVKIVELSAKGNLHQNHLVESNNELYFSHIVNETPLLNTTFPYQEAATRKRPETDTLKIYSITPLKGKDSYAMCQEGKLHLSQVMNLAVQFMQLVFFLQQKNILHRDIKSPNIIVSVQEDWQLNVGFIDFGSAVFQSPEEHPWYERMRAGTFELLCPRMRVIVQENERRYVQYVREYQIYKSSLLSENPQDHMKEPTFELVPYTYNFATEMYAAAESAKRILYPYKNWINYYVQCEWLSEEESKLFERIYSLTESITNLDVFQEDSDLCIELEREGGYDYEEFINIPLDQLKDALSQMQQETKAFITKSKNIAQKIPSSLETENSIQPVSPSPQTTHEPSSRNLSRDRKLSQSFGSDRNSSVWGSNGSLFSTETKKTVPFSEEKASTREMAGSHFRLGRSL